MALTSEHTVLVLGLGHSGLAMARWCAAKGATVKVWDSRAEPPQATALREAVPSAQLLSGALDADALAGVQLVLKSPGLAPGDERIAPLLAAARAQGIALSGELQLFIEALAQLKSERGYTPQILAITGTNGKTTTTALTALLVERAGRTVAMAGNIGPTLLDTLVAAIAQDPLPQVWVLELSSFQLDGVQGFEPSAATVLNLSQDHLDWHGGMPAYAAAKARVFGDPASHATVMVINHDDMAVEAMVPAPVMTPVRGKGGRGKPVQATGPKVIRFGLDAPQRPGDYGLVVENGMAWLVRALEADVTLKRMKGEVDEIHLQRLMPADALRLRGRHNAANALAALALAQAIGCPLAPMLHGLRDYRGEPHRVEVITRCADIEVFDDSKGTNVGATLAALSGLGQDKAPGKLLLILGGQGKGQDFSPLVAAVTRYVRGVALIGQDAGLIESALGSCGVPLVHHASLPAATAWCLAQAERGDAVVLSPACASLDMFRNYGHRAEVFVQAVQAWAHEHGETVV